MPIYEYECTACSQRTEVEQRFTDDPLTTCASCGGTLRKVYSAVGVVFKGSGFYKTDSRSSSSASSARKESKESKESGGSSSDSSAAPAAPATPSTSVSATAAPSTTTASTDS